MIDHIVMLSLADDADQPELAEVMTGLAALKGKIPGFFGFRHGENIDLEAKSPGFAYGFIGQFESHTALQAYAVDPRHRALGARLVALCKGGGDGILVFDIERAD